MNSVATGVATTVKGLKGVETPVGQKPAVIIPFVETQEVPTVIDFGVHIPQRARTKDENDALAIELCILAGPIVLQYAKVLPENRPWILLPRDTPLAVFEAFKTMQIVTLDNYCSHPGGRIGRAEGFRENALKDKTRVWM